MTQRRLSKFSPQVLLRLPGRLGTNSSAQTPKLDDLDDLGNDVARSPDAPTTPPPDDVTMGDQSPKGKALESEQRIDFFAKDGSFFWLSNNADYPVTLDGVRYATAEHLFQAHKFLEHRPNIAAKVRKASSPIEAIRIARTHAKDVRADWIRDGVNVITMRSVLLLKFTQHSNLRLALLETGDTDIVHASPNDVFWGSAAPPNSVGRGRNMLGRTLMQTRELLSVAAGVAAGSGTHTV
ncbi:hypothetical protein MSPP1_002917 [Malassezia sp. CBS 17886]|nr:hypothetical protein MSPP1_002917 [Malassezia sp. CBS 17886]